MSLLEQRCCSNPCGVLVLSLGKLSRFLLLRQNSPRSFAFSLPGSFLLDELFHFQRAKSLRFQNVLKHMPSEPSCRTGLGCIRKIHVAGFVFYLLFPSSPVASCQLSQGGRNFIVDTELFVLGKIPCGLK